MMTHVGAVAVIDSCERDENIFFGALKFSGESLVRERKVGSFVEVYDGRIPVNKIPSTIVTFVSLPVKH